VAGGWWGRQTFRHSAASASGIGARASTVEPGMALVGDGTYGLTAVATRNSATPLSKAPLPTTHRQMARPGPGYADRQALATEPLITQKATTKPGEGDFSCLHRPRPLSSRLSRSPVPPSPAIPRLTSDVGLVGVAIAAFAASAASAENLTLTPWRMTKTESIRDQTVRW
jgi:hypothetical protein